MLKLTLTFQLILIYLLQQHYFTLNCNIHLLLEININLLS
jgi:hypothetical protein